jgi:hypothetical protein
MKSLKTLLLSRSIATAFAVAGIAATIGTPLASFALTANQLGTPNDGMVCRAGYTPNFNGTSLKCSKTSEINVELACLDPVFPNKVVRAPAGGTPEGLDVCDKPGGVTITSSNDISNFVKGSDYVFAKKDDAQIALRTANQNQAEATALGLQVNEVETEAGLPVTNTTAGDSIDKSRVPLTFFTFPIKTLGGVIGGGPLTPATPFVPRALPR